MSSTRAILDCLTTVKSLGEQVHHIQSQIDSLIDQVESHVLHLHPDAQPFKSVLLDQSSSFSNDPSPIIKPRPVQASARRYSIAAQHRSWASLNNRRLSAQPNDALLPVLNDEAVEKCISRSSLHRDDVDTKDGENTNSDEHIESDSDEREHAKPAVLPSKGTWAGSVQSLKHAVGKKLKGKATPNLVDGALGADLRPQSLARDREEAIEAGHGGHLSGASGRFLSRRKSEIVKAGKLVPIDRPDVLPRFQLEDLEAGRALPMPPPEEPTFAKPKPVEVVPPHHLIPIKHRPRRKKGQKKQNITITSSAFAGISASFNKWYLDNCTIPLYTEFMVPYTPLEMADVYKWAAARPSGWMWHSRCQAKAVWELMMAIVIMFAIAYIPFVVTFIPEVGHLGTVSVLLTIVFVFDSCLSFLMSPTNGYSPFWVFGRTTALARDVLTILPLDRMISGQYSECFLYLRLIRAHSLYGIFSHNPLLRRFTRFLQSALGVGDSFAALIMYTSTLAAYFHVFSCSIFLLGRIYNFEGWVDIDTAYLIEESIGARYTFGMFVAAFQAEAFRPKQLGEQWNLILSAIISAALHGAVLGTVSSLINSLDPLGRMYKQKIEEVNEYMKYKNIDVRIRSKVREYFHLKYRGKYFNEGEILHELNDSLRQEIVIHNCRELITQVSFLARKVGDGRDEHFLGRIASALKPVYYVEGDTIFEQGR
ncbi:hypothetical protein HKX48_009326, partial [Thoreauomyces humboldtii]